MLGLLTQSGLARLADQMAAIVYGWGLLNDSGSSTSGAMVMAASFAALVIGYEGGALPAEALYTTESLEWGASNLVGLLIIPLFILFTRPGRPKASQHRQDSDANR